MESDPQARSVSGIEAKSQQLKASSCIRFAVRLSVCPSVCLFVRLFVRLSTLLVSVFSLFIVA